MSDVVFGLVDTVRSAIKMAYAALGVSNLNAQKILELDGRLKDLEAQIVTLIAEYEAEKSLARGKAISAGKWRAKAKRLKDDLDRLSSQIGTSTVDAEPTGGPMINENLLRKVDELDLSVHLSNHLKNNNIVYVGDLVQRSEAEMLLASNPGRKSVHEIKEVLANMGLHLGMEIPGWPPENIEELSRRINRPPY
jgi:hypothetical protein